MPRFDKLLVLDLDETLLHTRAAPLDGREPHGVIGPWVAYRRPHVAAFLDAALDLFEVGVWTSAGAGYAAMLRPGVRTSDGDGMVCLEALCHAALCEGLLCSRPLLAPLQALHTAKFRPHELRHRHGPRQLCSVLSQGG